MTSTSPDTLSSRLADATALLQAGQLELACRDLEALVTEIPTCDQAWYLLGLIALQNSDIESAISLLAHAHQLAPQQPDYVFALCEASVRANQVDQAQGCYEWLSTNAPAYVANLSAAVLVALAPVSESLPVASATLLPSQTVYKYRLRAIFQQAILHCTLSQCERWWDYPGLSELFVCESVAQLRLFLRVFILRRCGDFKLYLRLSRELNSLGVASDAEDRFLDLMASRYATALTRIQTSVTPADDPRRPFMLDLTVWGAPYIDKFLQFCAPSLLAPGNLDVLCCERKAILLLHTDVAGEAHFRAAPALAQMQALGLEVRFLQLDEALLAQTSLGGNNKYWHLGMTQSLGLAYAKALAADFHAMFPDTLFGAGYFQNMLRIARNEPPAIVQTAFRTAVELIEPAIAAYRQGNSINIPPADLMSIGLNCIHPTWHYTLLNARPDSQRWPGFHALMWEGEDVLHLACPHLAAVYVRRDVVASLPERFYFTLDSELDKILGGRGDAYFQTRDDGLAIIELSPGEADGFTETYLGAHEYAQLFWSRSEGMAHLAIFDQHISFPLNSALRVSAHKALPAAQIATEMTEVRTLVRSQYPAVNAYAMMNGLLALHVAEMHPHAQPHFAALHEHALRIWESGCAALGPAVSVEHARQIERMLWHFDCLPQARESLSRREPAHFLIGVIDAWQDGRARNDAYAQKLWQQVGKEKKVYVLGTTIWGDAYLDFFLDYHLGSLLAPGNLPHLARQGKVILSIVTNAAGRARIEAAVIYTKLRQYAELHFTCFAQPPQRREPEQARLFYMQYGLLDHHHVMFAHALGANLFLLPPDTVISSHGLHTLVSEIDAGHDGCTVACIEAYQNAARPELDALCCDGVLSASADQLSAVAVRHKTSYFRSLVFDAQHAMNSYPREFFWRVPGGYICHSIFMHPVLMSARVLQASFHPNYENTDWALIPRLLQGSENIKVLDDSQGLFILHCSEDNPRANEVSSFKGVVSPQLGEYLLGVNQHNYPIHRHFFRQRMFFPVEDSEVATNSSYLADSALLLAMFSLPEVW